MGRKKKPAERRGPRGKYRYWLTEEGLALLEDWSRNGSVDHELAKKMKVHPSTLYEWMKKYTQISDAIKNVKHVADAKVENSMFKSSVGYYYIEEQPIKVKKVYKDEMNRRVEEETIEVVPVKKYQPPIPTNQLFYLKNRRPAAWKDKQQVEIESKTPITLIIEKIKGDEY